MPLSSEDHDRPSFVIRSAEPTDLDQLRDLYREASLANSDDREKLLSRPESVLLSDESVRQERCRVAVDADDHLLGFSSYLAPGDVVELEDLFVAPTAWRRGVGRALILDVVALARAQHRARVTVTANPNALAFYEKMGFTFDHDVTTEWGPAARLTLVLT
jgi:GNAT superfamily N-acetyltransferase